MKKLFLLSALILNLSVLQSASQSFSSLLKNNRLNFSLPRGFTTTSVKENADIQYDFAIKSITRTLEIRYKVMPVEQNSKNSTVDPHTMYSTMLLTMALNISDGKLPNISKCESDDVQKEYNADVCQSTFVLIDSEFGKGYKVCMIQVIHKNNVADIYLFYLFDDIQQIMDLLFRDDVIHTVKFL